MAIVRLPDSSGLHGAALAPEVRFRVRAANSQPRSVRVVSLGTADDAELQACRAAYGVNVRFSRASELEAFVGRCDLQANDWPREMNAAADAIAGWLGTPHLAIIVGSEGDDPAAAAFAARAWQRRGVTVSAVLRAAASRPDSAGNTTPYRTADALRAHCTMLVLATRSDYLVDLLDALGAARDIEAGSSHEDE